MHTHPTRANARPLICTPDQLTSQEPHVIVRATWVTPPRFGGESIEVDWMLSQKAYDRMQRKAT
jgi:hypothetical protein